MTLEDLCAAEEAALTELAAHGPHRLVRDHRGAYHVEHYDATTGVTKTIYGTHDPARALDFWNHKTGCAS